MTKFIKMFKYGQKGFTLVELLVVIAILGILAGVAVPNVTKFIGSGKKEAAKTELQTVQMAMDTYMADTSATTVAAQTETNDLASSTPSLSTYLRNTTTSYHYSWDTAGKVTQTDTP